MSKYFLEVCFPAGGGATLNAALQVSNVALGGVKGIITSEKKR